MPKDVQSLCQIAIDETLLSERDVGQVVSACEQATGEISSSSFIKEALARGKLTRFQAKLLATYPTHPLSLGNYLLIDKIGQGGMGSVYKARHKTMERIVAVKVLSRKGRMTQELVRRFQREVQAAAKLIHPNIVTAFDAGVGSGIHYLVMEYIEGQDLRSHIAEHGPLSFDKAVNYILQAAQGFRFAHRNHVIHRDIKPSNLLLDREGVIKILDLGLARIVQSQSLETFTMQELTADGDVMGTIDYLSPEQGLDAKNADERSDIYSLGCTLHFFLTGRPVFPEGTPLQRILAHRDASVPSLHRSRDETPIALDQLFQQMLAKKPADRPQSMSEIINVLKVIAQELSPDASQSATNNVSPLGTCFTGSTETEIDASASGVNDTATLLTTTNAPGPAIKMRTEDVQTGHVSTQSSVSQDQNLLATVPKLIIPTNRRPRRRQQNTWQLIGACSSAFGFLAIIAWWMIAIPIKKNQLSASHSIEIGSLAKTSSESDQSSQRVPPVADLDPQVGDPGVPEKNDKPESEDHNAPFAKKESAVRSVTGPSSSPPAVLKGKLFLRIIPAGSSVVMQNQLQEVIHDSQSTENLQPMELPQGDYRLVVRHEGYQEYTELLRVASNQETVRELVLKKIIFNAHRPMKGSAVTGGYTIDLLGTGSLDGMQSLMDFKPDINIQNGQGNSFGNITTNNFGNSQTFNNQNGTGGAVGGFGTTTAGGGGGGFAGTGGATYSGGGIPANLGIALKIEADKAKAKGKREFVELSPKIKLTNNDGSINESEDTRPLRITYPQFEKRFPGCYAAYVHRPRGTDSTIKTIEGELLVTPGRKLSAIFTDSKPQKKKVDGEIFQLQKLESNQQGTMVQMTFPETALMKKANNMFEKFQAFTQSTGSFDVMLLDYDGNVYLPSGKSSSGGGSGSVQGFSFNGTTQTRTNQSQEPSMTTMNFQFKPLPQGTEITKIIAVMTEKEGETKAIPFTMDLTEK